LCLSTFFLREKDDSDDIVHRVSKNCVNFLSELRQISTALDNFWQKDGKEAKIMRGALTLSAKNIKIDGNLTKV